MTKSQQYLEFILQANKWYNSKMKQLQLIIDKENDSKIMFQGDDGGNVELPEEMKKGFHFGIQTAIEVLGEFPIKISQSNESN